MDIRIKLGHRKTAATALLLAVLGPASGKDDALRPQELVRQAVHSEISSNAGESGRHFMFKDEKRTAHLTQTKLLVETRDATAGMVIAQDGHSLSLEQRQQEEQRLTNYAQNGEELSKKRRQEKEDAERTERILRALPDAFLYESEGTEMGSTTVGRPGEHLMRLKFRANPAYDPPSRVEQVLTGMEGHLLIDATDKRVAEIDGTLQKDVSFGWGILGRLDRGGRFLVQQADIGGHQWEITHMELSFTGKILLVKRMSIHSSDMFSDFHPVPSDLTFAQGVELLKKQAQLDRLGAKVEHSQEKTKNGSKSPLNNQAERQLRCER
jgi:hypothetical protein